MVDGWVDGWLMVGGEENLYFSTLRSVSDHFIRMNNFSVQR